MRSTALAINRNYFSVKDFSTINLKCNPISSPPAQGNVHIKCVSRGAGYGAHRERRGETWNGERETGNGIHGKWEQKRKFEMKVRASSVVSIFQFPVLCVRSSISVLVVYLHVTLRESY